MELVNDTDSRFRYYLNLQYVQNTSDSWLFAGIEFSIANHFGTLYKESLTIEASSLTNVFDYLLAKNKSSTHLINYAQVQPIEYAEQFIDFAQKLDAKIFLNSKNKSFF